MFGARKIWQPWFSRKTIATSFVLAKDLYVGVKTG
jgi:hypothetical protein